MKLVYIYQTRILHLSVNKGVTAEEVRHSEKVSSFINYLQGHKCTQCDSIWDTFEIVSDMHLTAVSFFRLFAALNLSSNIRK